MSHYPVKFSNVFDRNIQNIVQLYDFEDNLSRKKQRFSKEISKKNEFTYKHSIINNDITLR